MPDRRGVRERSSQSNQAPITQRRDVSLNIGPASVVPANSYADHTFEYLDDGGAVFLIESGGPAHLVDLLAQIRHQQWYTKRLGVAGLQFLVLVRNINRPARREVAREHARHAVLELHAVAGAHADDLKNLARVEPGLLAEHQRLRDRDRGDLAEHVVDQLHRKAVAEIADMEDVFAHRAKQILAGGEGFGRPADDHRQGTGRRAVSAASSSTARQLQ